MREEILLPLAGEYEQGDQVREGRRVVAVDDLEGHIIYLAQLVFAQHAVASFCSEARSVCHRNSKWSVRS